MQKKRKSTYLFGRDTSLKPFNDNVVLFQQVSHLFAAGLDNNAWRMYHPYHSVSPWIFMTEPPTEV